ncbi:MAG TPA: dihydrofolate reductase family protein [Acidimicrobiales bacterium]|nr:dihydrofolate reductase family protein [Acidimicrobiales bacterium]
MRRIVAGLFMSLDGVVESPEKWQGPYFNDEMGAELGAQMAQSDALLMGRRTYEEFAAFWPSQGSAGPAGFMNNVRKLVVSTTLRTPGWQNSKVIGGDLSEELTTLKRRTGGNILVSGSITLVSSLLRHGLLDELGVMVCPVVIGTGRHLFEDSAGPIPLALAASNTLDNGVLHLTYRPAAG